MGGSTNQTQNPTSTSSVTNNEALGQQGAGTTNNGSSNVALDLTGATSSSVSFISQSPEALAAAGQAIAGALQLAEATTQGSLNYAGQQAASAADLAKNSSGTGTAQATTLLTGLGLIALAGLAIFLFFRKKG